MQWILVCIELVPVKLFSCRWIFHFLVFTFREYSARSIAVHKTDSRKISNIGTVHSNFLLHAVIKYKLRFSTTVKKICKLKIGLLFSFVLLVYFNYSLRIWVIVNIFLWSFKIPFKQVSLNRVESFKYRKRRFLKGTFLSNMRVIEIIRRLLN